MNNDTTTRTVYRIYTLCVNIAEARTLEALPAMTAGEVFDAVMAQVDVDPELVAEFDDKQEATKFFHDCFRYYGYTRPVNCGTCWALRARVAYITMEEYEGVEFAGFFAVVGESAEEYAPDEYDED